MVKSKRIYQIDLFRFIAALSVVFYHYFFRGYAADEMSDLNFEDVGGLFKYGYLGVDLFFIISGFVITLSINKRSISKFIISRITRLYPIYWMCVSLTFLVVILFGSPRYHAQLVQYILNLTMFHNYLGIESIDGVYWTLFVEMKFYIFVIGSYLIINKIKRIDLDYLVYFWTSLSLLFLFMNNIYILKVINFFFILNWSSYFIAGIVFYQIYNRGISLQYFFLLMILFLLSLHYAFLKIEFYEMQYNAPFSKLIGGGIIFIFYLIMLLVATNKLKSINSPKLISLGMLTYPLYLIHQIIGFIILNNLGIYFNKYVVVAATLIVMLVVSYLLSKYYEPYFSNYLKIKLEKFSAKYKNKKIKKIKNLNNFFFI
ncbi:acyltransferase family protein [Lutimonas zeaxanthinifaciens]|uniref:acyltransferase family protein n=1 Tax=Lutimonas zeaxanthinifaciens TaxID=3060215 RepID=UPI00265CABE7|nr:acyltransferase [Lutimonas sp. YSD2104]WKK67098.1 acyltransferase [Lutimonas sp. YSD2104]